MGKSYRRGRVYERKMNGGQEPVLSMPKERPPCCQTICSDQ